jgi:hypothetical protein
MNRKSLVGLMAALILLLVGVHRVGAQENPFQLALVGPTIQLVDDDEDVRGIRLNLIYGVNRNVTGLDLGLINHANGQMTGVEFGVVNVVDGGFAGWQSGLVNVTDVEFTGWQSGLVNVSKGQFTGLQWAPWNAVWSPWSVVGLANFAEAAEGAQVAAAFNRAEYMRGFQLSLVNVADDMYGIQVGLINVIRSKDDFPILPLVNWKFD